MPQDNNKKAPGRPSKYIPEIVSEILTRIKDGETLIQICKSEHLPSATTVRNWKTSQEGFLALYAEARKEQQHTWADQIVDIANDDSRDTLYTEFYSSDGKLVKKEGKSDNSAVLRDRLRVDTFKWLMARLAAVDYGDKVEQQITGKDGKELSIVVNIGPKGNNT